MVFLVFTLNGLKEALSLAKLNNAAVWCTSDVLSGKELSDMKEPNITRFDYSFTVLESETLG